MEGLMRLADVRDPRRGGGRRKHVFREIVAVAILAVLSGAESFNDMEDFGNQKLAWLRTFMELPFGVPSHDTFNRALRTLPPGEFEARFRAWAAGLAARGAGGAEEPRRAVAVDGKALRRAGDGGKAPVIVGAWDAGAGAAVGQELVDSKSNEITAAPGLLKGIGIGGKVVTMDAMGCQKELARLIVSRDGDYVLALKSNHGTAFAEMSSFMEDAVLNTPERLSFREEADKGHGRTETRRCWQSGELDWFEDRGLWAGLRSVAMVEGERTVKGATSRERRLYLSSLEPDAGEALRVTRGHWGIENRLHYRLDTQLGEDASRARTGHAAQNLAVIRRVAVNVLGRGAGGVGLRRRRKNAAWSTAYLEAALAADA